MSPSLCPMVSGVRSLLRNLGALLVLAGGTPSPDRARARKDGTLKLGACTLAEKIGEGAMGVVYKAHHPRFDRPVAVKVLHAEHASPEAVRRFEREVALTSRLTHPNTVAIYDSGRTKHGDVYYVMDYLEGVDLETLVAEEGPLEPAHVAHVLAEVASALAEAHGKGLIHRDVKPANIMVCRRGAARGSIKLLDFGLSKEFGAEASSLTQEDLNRLVGTPLYVSPEALLAPESMDGRSDLYALGGLGYFLLTGEPPFTGKSVLEVCAQHLHAEPLPPSLRRGRAVPRALERLILSCLEKSVERRPESAEAVLESLSPLVMSGDVANAAA